MAILLSLKDTELEPWIESIYKELGSMELCIYPEIKDREAIEYAIVWKHPHGDLKNYPNLKAILSCGAGVDHIVDDHDYPKSVPIVRLHDEKLSQDMCLYALHWVLHFHSDYYQYTNMQPQRNWNPQPLKLPKKCRIGVMGLGTIGKKIADTLIGFDFKVSGWGATNKPEMESLPYFYGTEQVSAFLSTIDILINVLPLTTKTNNLLDKRTLKRLPRGAFIINIGRGGIVNEADLISLLDDGHIRGATLDVFATEPLPNNDPLWSHPRVYITPHIAGQNNPQSAVSAIAKNIIRLENSEEPFPLYSPSKGY
jgi:glyoxylate/hydroxypyruvate reductase A